MKKLLFLCVFALISGLAFSQELPKDSVILGERTVGS
jgi:hypothetical protein